MSPMAVLSHGPMLNLHATNPNYYTRRPMKPLSCLSRLFLKEKRNAIISRLFRNRPGSFKQEDRENYEAPKDITDRQDSISSEILKNVKRGNNNVEIPFLVMVAIALGIAVIATIISITLERPSLGTSLGLQILSEGSSSSAVSPAHAGFNFKAFGYKIILPEYAPGWIYFWLLMAAGCGLFISEEALNIWVGITLSRLLSLDGTWQSFAESFSRNASYIISTVLWVYWGVCISDLVPFYLGKLFRQSGASDDISSRLGISKEKALEITQVVQKYGNLMGFVERFSLGARNPTGFLAGVMGISPECFFAGVCCGCLFTLPLQLGIGFLLRERPVFALATVATVVGVWTIFPYAMAASTALFFYLRSRYSS